MAQYVYCVDCSHGANASELRRALKRPSEETAGAPASRPPAIGTRRHGAPSPVSASSRRRAARRAARGACRAARSSWRLRCPSPRPP
eukprot:2178978-Prymnesium_polylepis.1